MHKTRCLITGEKRVSPIRRASPPLLSALAGQFILRPGHQVVRRTMSQLKYADVSLSNSMDIETRTLILIR